MMQLYFLSVLALCVTGLGLFFNGNQNPKYQFFSFVDNQLFKLITGIVTFLLGLINLFAHPEGTLVILEDFIPSLAGLFGGFTMLFNYYLDKRTTEPSEKYQKFEKFFTENNKYFGITCMVVALIHFLFAKVVIL
ncbi:MAG: hypothetical protein K5839_03590 [Treponemataceae bacterium]|nr:hypothetical protein [Treponemataceae bacterium]